jgi:hypothetical protein
VKTLVGTHIHPKNMQCSKLSSRAVRAALRASFNPACFFMDNRQWNGTGGAPWDLIGNDSLFDVSVVARGSRFYGVYTDPSSIIGLRRERPAVIQAVPWGLLRELFHHLAASRRYGHSPLPLPPTLSGAEFAVQAGVGRQDASASASHRSLKTGKRGRRRKQSPRLLALSAIVQHTLYVNGNTQALDALDLPLRRELMAAVDSDLTVDDVGAAAGVRPWISSGGTESVRAHVQHARDL